MLYQLSYASSFSTGNLPGSLNVRGHTPTFRVHGSEIKVSIAAQREQTSLTSNFCRIFMDLRFVRSSPPATGESRPEMPPKPEKSSRKELMAHTERRSSSSGRRKAAGP